MSVFENDVNMDTMRSTLELTYYVLIGACLDATPRDVKKAREIIEMVHQFSLDFPLQEALENSVEEED
jgi:hypothetical protein